MKRLGWLTAAIRAYRETVTDRSQGAPLAEISLPVAITVFPEEVYRTPETWARRADRNLIYFHEVDRGGHFADWEQPELFATEFRAAFKSLRPADGKVAER